ncbi:type VI secretion system-associated protein TagF [Roseibium sp. HPY-6]|uniref:type VI secretion system-associated protein TagF n=1 Tax=Roseibium sp. HPY-6 TaxID=3229852 RepID=UPI00338F5E8C
MQQCGFFGKRPLERDFVFEGLTAGMTDAWAAMMSDWLISAQSAFPQNWIDHYFDAPAWRFAIPPGLLGPSAWCGLLCASADALGRAFPLAVLIPAQGRIYRLLFDSHAESVLDALEMTAMAFIEGQISRKEFQTAIVESEELLRSRAVPEAGTDELELSAENEAVCLRFARTSEEAIIAENALCLRRVKALDTAPPRSYWWQDGSENRPPELCVWKGLPKGSGTGGFLAGFWETFGWQQETIDPDRILRP